MERKRRMEVRRMRPVRVVLRCRRTFTSHLEAALELDVGLSYPGTARSGGTGPPRGKHVICGVLDSVRYDMEGTSCILFAKT